MELNREQIIKALECCGGDIVECQKCAYAKKGYNKCKECAAQDALSLIKELTEENKFLSDNLVRQSAENVMIIGENERFRKQLDDRCDLCIEADNARTVRKMTELLIRRLPIISPSVFRGIANEMLEEG